MGEGIAQIGLRRSDAGLSAVGNAFGQQRVLLRLLHVKRDAGAAIDARAVGLDLA